MRKKKPRPDPLVRLLLDFPELFLVEEVHAIVSECYPKFLEELREQSRYPILQDDEKWISIVGTRELQHAMENLIVRIMRLFKERRGHVPTYETMSAIFKPSKRSIKKLFLYGLFNGEFSNALKVVEKLEKKEATQAAYAAQSQNGNCHN